MRITPPLLSLIAVVCACACTPKEEPKPATPTTTAVAAARRVRFQDFTPAELDERAKKDAERFQRTVLATNRLTKEIAASAVLFDRPADVVLKADERDQALTLFSDVLDHSFALDALARFHLEFWRLNLVTNPERHARHFDLGFAAYLEKHALALALVDTTINKPQFEKLFDEGSIEHGIPAGAYMRLKWAVVHVEDVAKTLTAHQYLKVLAPANAVLRREDRVYTFVLERLDDRYDVIKTKLTSKSVDLFGGNTVDIGVDFAHAAWFPVQAETAEWLGDTKVLRKNSMLISLEQVREAAAKSEPGDVIVERRNWYLSNIGLPGFWPHAALWVGSPDELTAWSNDPELTKAFGKPFVQYLMEHHAAAWKSYIAPDHEGNPRRILEAISEGVSFNAAEESIRADYVAAIRPKLSKLDKAKAIDRAFGYAGRPYDFDFDFYTDSSLVCSELVYKAYEPREGMPGLKLGLEKVVGRMAMGPNAIVRTFDEQAGGKDEQFTFAWFLDGTEKGGNAKFVDAAAFRASWKRPKWDIVQQ
ncbi:MAG: YiiX/YebB-like N1pC/P60 family cysteine hydrolase [Deltaproteobacteria bacterium]|nr:YiiX/YebB-like N1pC/P60 family cysteine hydrolase [Deltaproteobacteria bacterium]